MSSSPRARRRPHRAAPRSLQDPLAALVARLAPATPLARVQVVWEQAVGPAIAGVARPVAEREGALSVVCVSAVWAHELDLMGPELLARVNSALGDEVVTRLRCRVG